MAKKSFRKSSKVPFSDLPDSFKEAMDAAQSEDLQKTLADIHKDDERNAAAKKADQDLKEKQTQAAEAGRAYRDIAKTNKSKTAYVIQLLAGRGEALSSEIVSLKLASK